MPETSPVYHFHYRKEHFVSDHSNRPIPIVKDLMTIRQAAKTLGISERNLWGRLASGEIPKVKIGRLIRIDPDDLSMWIAQQKQGGRL